MRKPHSASCSHVGGRPARLPVVDRKNTSMLALFQNIMLLQALDREGVAVADQTVRGDYRGRTTTQTADARGTPAGVATDGGSTDWLNSAPAPAPEHFSLLDPFRQDAYPAG